MIEIRTTRSDRVLLIGLHDDHSQIAECMHIRGVARIDVHTEDGHTTTYRKVPDEDEVSG